MKHGLPWAWVWAVAHHLFTSVFYHWSIHDNRCATFLIPVRNTAFWFYRMCFTCLCTSVSWWRFTAVKVHHVCDDQVPIRYTCALRQGCLMSHIRLHTSDCKMSNEMNWIWWVLKPPTIMLHVNICQRMLTPTNKVVRADASIWSASYCEQRSPIVSNPQQLLTFQSMLLAWSKICLKHHTSGPYPCTNTVLKNQCVCILDWAWCMIDFESAAFLLQMALPCFDTFLQGSM